MSESQVPVDLFNPGQVFACIGLVEAADVLLGNAQGVFAWDSSGARFRVAAEGDERPVARIQRFLDEAEVIARAPHGSPSLDKWKKGKKGEEEKKDWGDVRHDEPDAPFPFRDPGAPEKLPAVLRDASGAELEIDYWGDTTQRDNVKFWTGPNGYPGTALVRDGLKLMRGKLQQYEGDPFALFATQSSSFRFDWRRDYVPKDAGFSPNKHDKIVMRGFPFVEILAAVGMTHARPARLTKTKLAYRYGALGGDELCDPVLLRASLGTEAPPVPGRPFRRFVMHMDWPGQEGQARCITHVIEEEV